MWRFMLIAFLPGLAFAGSVQDETNGCMFKSETAELRECLSDLFYRRGAELDKRIASATASAGLSDLQADVMASKLESAQTAWRVDTDELCGEREVISRELCRISSLEVREVELSFELDRAMNKYGG